MTDPKECSVCGETNSGPVETAHVRSNVRAFVHEHFRVWRCGNCQSIHAWDEVDLDRYYQNYPLHRLKLDAPLKMGYRRLLGRLKRAGLERSHRILDFGCGGGQLVTYLTSRGYNATGFDPHFSPYDDPVVLEDIYDCCIAQDVIEHVLNPISQLAALSKLVSPGGLVAIGMPNASGIDLGNLERHVHALHQPYHRHILAVESLVSTYREQGLDLVRLYRTPYSNLPIPSLPFLQHYAGCFDGTLDVFLDRPILNRKLWMSPTTYWYLLFGYFLCDDADVFAVFSRRAL